MFGISRFISDLMIGCFWVATPAFVIALIVNLFIRNSREKAVSAEQESGKNNNGATNVLLYIGSFLIFGSMILSIGSDPVASIVIYITVMLLSYLAGIILYQAVPFLRPVAIAFTYTGMALFPFLANVLKYAGLTPETAFCISSILSFIAFSGAAVFTRSNLAGWLSYIALIFSGWSIANLVGGTFFTYAFFIWPIIVSYLPMAFWLKRVKWLPVPFRAATKAFAYVLAPAAIGIAAFTFMVPDFAINYPFLRTIIVVLALGTSLLSWGIKKTHGSFIAVRFYLQALILAIIADSTNYSIVYNFSSEKIQGVSLAIAIVWLVTFLMQTICALFLPQRDEDAKNKEKIVLVISLFGIFLTSALCLDFSQTDRAILSLVMAGVIAALGLVITLRYRNPVWGIASAAGLCYIPYEISRELLTTPLNPWILFAIYVAISALFIGAYALIRKRKPKESLSFIISSLFVTNLFALSATYSIGWTAASWALLAASIAGVAAISRRNSLLELSVYSGAIAVYSYLDTLGRMTGLNYSEWEFFLTLLRYLVIGAAVFGVGIVKERHEKSTPRLIIGFIIMAFACVGAVADTYTSTRILTSFIAILTQVCVLIYGAFARRSWIAITSAVIITGIILHLSSDSLYLWLAVIGAGLIGIVIWQLAKNNKKQ